MKKVCVVTASRAEYGLLRPILFKLREDKDIELNLVVTGMHLSPEFGFTYREIEKDNLEISEKIEILMSSNTAVGNCKTMALATSSFGEYFYKNKPDLLLVLGDRYEMFAIVSAAVINNIPIAHMHGGEITECAFDDAFRHSITKMSNIHFASTEEYRNRIIQMGENPLNVFNTGAIGVQNIENIKLKSREELEKDIEFKLDPKFALVTYHPVTLGENNVEEDVNNLLSALDEFEEYKFIITKANADKDGFLINNILENYAKLNPERIKLSTSLGIVNYLSAMKYASAVIGNSSSGIIEAPSFNIPTVNIGDRQKGRVQSKTTINCMSTKEEILTSMKKAFSEEFKGKCRKYENPYKKDGTCENIINEIKKYLHSNREVSKKFYNIY